MVYSVQEVKPFGDVHLGTYIWGRSANGDVPKIARFYHFTNKQNVQNQARPQMTYLLVGNQCDNVASKIMRAGNKGYYVSNRPNWSFEGVSKDWSLSIINMGE